MLMINREIVGKRKTLSNNTIHFKISGKETANQSTIWNAFNHYFLLVGSNLAEKSIHFDNPISYVKSINSMFISYNYYREWDNTSIWKYKSRLGLHSRKYSKAIHRILVNSSFENRIFSDKFNMAKIIPIYRSGDTIDIRNSRTISGFFLWCSE